MLDTPVSLENQANIDPWKDYRPRSPSASSQNKSETSPSLPTVVQEVRPSLGTTTEQRQQLQSATHPLDIQDILGTETLQGYIQTPVQMLDGLVVNQPQRFLPLVEEAKRLAEEITKEQQAQQWASIPHEQLLNQSFTKQLMCIQTLEALAPSTWLSNIYRKIF